MTTAPLASVPAAAAKRLSRGAAIMALGGIGFVGYGLLFLVQNFTGFLVLGISRAEVDVGRADIQRFSPSLYHYISHLHIALAGFIAAAGVAVAALAWFGVRRGELWAWVTAVVVPVLALAVVLPAHYPWHLRAPGPDLRRHGAVLRRRGARPGRPAGQAPPGVTERGHTGRRPPRRPTPP